MKYVIIDKKREVSYFDCDVAEERIPIDMKHRVICDQQLADEHFEKNYTVTLPDAEGAFKYDGVWYHREGLV